MEAQKLVSQKSIAIVLGEVMVAWVRVVVSDRI